MTRKGHRPTPKPDVSRAEMDHDLRRTHHAGKDHTFELPDPNHPLKKEIWATPHRIAQLLQGEGVRVTGGAIGHRLKDAREIPSDTGVAVSGRKQTIFPVDLILRETAELINCKIIFPPTGIYIDEAGKKWMTMNALEKALTIPRKTIREYRSGIPTIRGRQESEKENRGPGPITTLYDLELVKKALAPLLSAKNNTTVQVDAKGYYIDEEGVTHLTWGAFWRDYAPQTLKAKMSDTTFKRRCRSLSSIEARNKQGVARASRPAARLYKFTDLQSLADTLGGNI